MFYKNKQGYKGQEYKTQEYKTQGTIFYPVNAG